MGINNSIISISEINNNTETISWLNSLKSYAIPSLNYSESKSRKPTLKEIYNSIENSGIQILSEKIESFSESNYTHIFEIKDNESEYGEDLTIRYKKGQSQNEIIESISGIKTDKRILIKLVCELTKFCGSMIIFNTYESFFIERGKNYIEIWNEINNNCS